MPAPQITFHLTSDPTTRQIAAGNEGLVICFSNDFEVELTRFPKPIAQIIQQAIINQLETGAPSLEMIIPSMGQLPVSHLIVYYNNDHLLTLQEMRERGARTSQLAAQQHIQLIAIDLDNCQRTDSVHTLEACMGAWTEGICLGSYTIKSYQQLGVRAQKPLQQVEFRINEVNNPTRLKQVIDQAIIYADATNYARDLTNLPSNMLTPLVLAEEAKKLADLGHMDCHVLEEAEIESLGMGGLSAVAQGSVHGPRMIVISHKGAPQSDTIYGLVGKGITFDTGGISLKNADGMEEMISDMGGAAVVLGVMQALSRLKLELNVTAVIPAAENMPSGSAYKPGDVITSMSGRTIEVLNTDAEGRIVLADALTYARQLGATKLIDVATLTGAVLVALGDVTTAAITNNEPFLTQFMKAAERSGEKVWQLPVFPEYKEMLKSSVADIKNSTGSKLAGAITGGLFIGAFADDTPWIHLDTGGTAWLWKERGMEPQGATGAMVRTLLQYLNDPIA